MNDFAAGGSQFSHLLLCAEEVALREGLGALLLSAVDGERHALVWPFGSARVGASVVCCDQRQEYW